MPRPAAPGPAAGRQGSRPACGPGAVACPVSSMAPSWPRTVSASARLLAGGASGRCRPSPPGAPQQASTRAAEARSATVISARGCAGAAAKLFSSKQRTTVPGPWRAARPARCTQEARDAETVTSPLMPRVASRRGSRASPESMTSLTPGTVSEDSASEVETMMRGAPPASRPETARSCSAGWTCPCSSSTSVPGARLRSCAATSATSQAPGRKTSASMAGFSASARAWARAAVAATWVRKVRDTPRSVSREPTPGAQSTVSGCSAEGQSTTAAGPSPAASPISAAKRGASRVADMASSIRSPRSSWTSRSMPTSRSVSRPRSCTSSMITASIPSSPGSANRRLQQDAGRHELHERFRARLVFPAHAEPDAGAQRAAVQRGQAPCGGACGNPAGLGDQDAPGSPARAIQHQVRHQRRHQGRLAGAGRRLDDGRPRFPARRPAPGQARAGSARRPGPDRCSRGRRCLGPRCRGLPAKAAHSPGPLSRVSGTPAVR